jgi:hypothetical protein
MRRQSRCMELKGCSQVWCHDVCAPSSVKGLVPSEQLSKLQPLHSLQKGDQHDWHVFELVSNKLSSATLPSSTPSQSRCKNLFRSTSHTGIIGFLFTTYIFDLDDVLVTFHLAQHFSFTFDDLQLALMHAVFPDNLDGRLLIWTYALNE